MAKRIPRAAFITQLTNSAASREAFFGVTIYHRLSSTVWYIELLRKPGVQSNLAPDFILIKNERFVYICFR